jgi:2-iminoacetate synthase ThiH
MLMLTDQPSYTVPRAEFLDLASENNPVSSDELDAILDQLDDRELTYAEVVRLVKPGHSSLTAQTKSRVISRSRELRARKHGTSVVPMAPVEVTNRCASNCTFCGWRSSNRDMRRLVIAESLVLLQVRYLVGKGITHIELVGGDDLTFVRELLPRLASGVRALLPEEGGVVHFCTMALTSRQYRGLREVGADSAIMWQETYHKAVYDREITAGPKAWGIDDAFKVTPGGDGFRFRLESQDRAIREGLAISVGSMLGLNPNVAFEMLATIDHARYLAETYRPASPVIVGMPTWNRITTPHTDLRPSQVIDAEDSFTYFASIYFLALHLHNVWIFPNCRVSLNAQSLLIYPRASEQVAGRVPGKAAGRPDSGAIGASENAAGRRPGAAQPRYGGISTGSKVAP